MSPARLHREEYLESYPDGEIVERQVSVACLLYSDYGFAMAVSCQSVEDFLSALSCCRSFLGGVSLALVPDNFSVAVTKANRYEPTLNQVLDDFASHCGTMVVRARVVKPRDEALVENQVKLIYQRVPKSGTSSSSVWKASMMSLLRRCWPMIRGGCTRSPNAARDGSWPRKRKLIALTL